MRQNDIIDGQCLSHKIIGSNGSAVPAPPMKFSAPITVGCARSVSVEGVALALEGSSGVNTPAHTPVLHPSDRSVAPPTQQGKVVKGSRTVLVEGKGAAFSGCDVTECQGARATVVGSGSSVEIGS